MKTIQISIESDNGDDTLIVPNTPSDIQNAVEVQLKDDKWVTMERTDGSKEMLTASDLPEKKAELADVDFADVDLADGEGDKIKKELEEKEKRENKEWLSKFENVKSATATHKAKRG